MIGHLIYSEVSVFVASKLSLNICTNIILLLLYCLHNLKEINVLNTPVERVDFYRVHTTLFNYL